MTSLVRIDGVGKSFGTDEPALSDITATIEPGTVTGLVGPDGAGKTTLIRLMAGLMMPDRGSISVFDLDTRTHAEKIQASIGYMPQRFGLYEDLTVQENLDLYAELRGLPRDQRADVFARLLDFTGLARFTERLAGRLSGGMKQKLGLACAMVQTPRLLLLDEPSVGVDPISRRELWRMIQDLAGREIGVLWSTSYLDEAEKCDRVILLNDGAMLFSGPPAEMTDRARGRVVRLVNIQGRRRKLLARMLPEPGVMDGVIQGRSVRLVLKSADEIGTIERLAASGPETAKVEPAEPRLEDAFVDHLGGGPDGRSKLAEAMPDVADRGQPVIEARGLSKRFGDFIAAQDMTFSIPRGEIFGLLGPNGAGKSTTFKMLCGLLPPSSGEGRVAGFDLRKARADARSRLGYMAQKFSLYGDLSVGQNLDFFAGVYGLIGAHKKHQIEAMIETFEFKRHLNDSTRDLPLGFKQRLALACAVMHGPEALFLDEPTSGVDPITRREFWTHINGLVEKGVSVLVTTHFMEEAEYCDRIALIYQGKRIANGSPDELKAQIATSDRPDPTLEDAFIAMVEASDAAKAAA
jgi:ABC-2 type transport system ATP-binding protein